MNTARLLVAAFAQGHRSLPDDPLLRTSAGMRWTNLIVSTDSHTERTPSRMEIVVPQTPGYVGLRIFRLERESSGDNDYFGVEVEEPSLQASARVYAYRAEGIVDLFAAMARDWKGWDGPRQWESLEGEFGLECTSDGKGHIELAISLSPSAWPHPWKVHATAQAEAGQLDGLADSVRRFFGREATN